ncbi:bifunctional metallophosphatase/5'-nucleotidase [Methylomusa anaerophila]|uniref:bifunctional metallophosphatase/5'-nucleotidase n=1 Tax=Methylomusa anaerophila TaxID=1930071 RepID=UPI001315823C|nr:5'-nucleotidase C-terminal domain-containing protein [Methylomusa anaerophila]
MLLLLVAATLILPAAAVTASPVTVTILATSDTHGHIVGWDYFTAAPAETGLAKVSTLVARERAKNSRTLLIDDGDFLQGTPLTTVYSSVIKDWRLHPVIAAFNAMHYDAIILGNHEFNFGLAFLQKAITAAECPVLSANTLDNQTQKVWQPIQPYLIREIPAPDKLAPIRVGIIGVTTQTIPHWENGENYAGLQFADQVATVRQIINEIKNRVDVIIVASHSGVEIDGQEALPGENQVAAIAKACPEVALIIAGHNHYLLDNATPVKDNRGNTVYDKSIVHGIPVLEPACWGLFLGKADLTLVEKNGHWQVTAVATANLPTEGIPEDPAVTTVARLYHDATLQYLNTKIGTATAAFTMTNGTLQDTSLINLINTVQRHYGKAQLSATPPYNPAARIDPGEIRLQHVAAICPYESYLYTIEISGTQLRQYLEHAAAYYRQFRPSDTAIGLNNNGTPDYNFDIIQGIDYVIDITRPAGQRIRHLTYRGRSVKNTDTFSLAINGYRLNGGGGYMAAIGVDQDHPAKILFDSQKSYGEAGQIRNLISQYIQDKGTISPHIENNWSIATAPVKVTGKPTRAEYTDKYKAAN